MKFQTAIFVTLSYELKYPLGRGKKGGGGGKGGKGKGDKCKTMMMAGLMMLKMKFMGKRTNYYSIIIIISLRHFEISN